MKPVLALTVHPALHADPEFVADLINAYLDREFPTGDVVPLVSVRALTTPDELQAWESGTMVMYRKPARRYGDRIVYEKDGRKVELEQMRAALE